MMIAEKERRYEITEYGLMIDTIISFDEWLQCGQHLWEVRRRIQWCIGDWLAFGERRWGEDYAQAMKVTQYSLQTLRNYAAISSAFPDQTYRGRYELSHSHFEAVKASDIPTAKKSEFLQAAVDNEMSRDDVRAAVKSWRGEPEPVRPWSMTCVPDAPEIFITLPIEYVGQSITITAKVNGSD